MTTTKDRALRAAADAGVTVETGTDTWWCGAAFTVDLTAPDGQAFEGGHGAHIDAIYVDGDGLRSEVAVWRAVIVAVRDLGTCICGDHDETAAGGVA